MSKRPKQLLADYIPVLVLATVSTVSLSTEVLEQHLANAIFCACNFGTRENFCGRRSAAARSLAIDRIMALR